MTAYREGSEPYVWYVILLLSVVNVCNYMDRVALSVLAPSIKADLNLSDAQIGLLIGFAFSLFYAVCGIPIAQWADRGVRRNIIAIMLVIWSVMTALSGGARNFWQLFAARVGVGAGEAGCLPTAQSIICDYVPPRARAGVYAIHTFGLMVGMMLGMALAGWLDEVVGWRLAFVVLGLPGIVLAVVVRLTLREPRRGFFDAAEEKTDLSFSATVRFLWRCRTYRLLVCFLVVNGFVNFGLTQWWPSFFARVSGLSLSAVGVYVGTAIAVGSGFGLLIGGLLANKAATRDIKLPLLIGAAATSLALPTALASLFVPSTSTSIVFIALTGLFWSVPNGPVVATLYGVVSSGLRARAGAISIFLTSVLGLGLGPFCVGLLSDLLVPWLGAQALRYALLAPICFLPLMVIALCAATRRLQEDLQNA